MQRGEPMARPLNDCVLLSSVLYAQSSSIFFISNRYAVVFLLPVNRYWPSAENASDCTAASNWRGRTTRPVSTFHARTVESSPPETSQLPSGENATALIRS